MAYLLILPVLSLCVIWCPATASQGDGRVDKMEDRFSTMERKLNQYIEEHGRLLQQNEELQRRVSAIEKKNDELTTKTGTLEETVKEILQSNAKCQVDVKQLSKIIEDNSDSFIWNNQEKNVTTTSSSNEVKSYSSRTHIRKRFAFVTVAPIEQIAFYAYLSRDTQANLRQHHTLVYDVVIINKGQGYHQDDGIFIVPSSGVYVFAMTVAIQTQGWASVEIVVNGVVFGSTFADGSISDWEHASGIVVVETHTGDHVYIRMQENGNGVVNSNARGRTSFSGWKLF